ncbi:MAG: 30S ribosomal protein S5, partial [bacterium]
METTPKNTTNTAPAGNNQRGGFRGGNRPGGDRGPAGRRPGGRGPSRFSKERVKPEYDQKMISIRRVARVVAGGRRFSFSVTLIAGDRKGKVGVGLGKAGDTSLAIAKAFNDAKKNMVRLSLTKTSSIAHELDAKYGSSVVILKPAKGRGIIAGSAVRTILELAGVKDVNAKIL